MRQIPKDTRITAPSFYCNLQDRTHLAPHSTFGPPARATCRNTRTSSPQVPGPGWFLRCAEAKSTLTSPVKTLRASTAVHQRLSQCTEARVAEAKGGIGLRSENEIPAPSKGSSSTSNSSRSSTSNTSNSSTSS
jgi:hypothetical protein